MITLSAPVDVTTTTLRKHEYSSMRAEIP